MGSYTNASGDYSTAMGIGSTASGNYATAIGQSTSAKALGSFSIGRLNDNTDNPSAITAASTDRIFQIGNGTDVFNLHNALTVLRNGNIGVGITNPGSPLSFPAFLEKKVCFYPGATGDVGIAVQGNYLQIYGDNPNAAVGLGYQQNALVSGSNLTGFQYNLIVLGNGNANLRGVLTENSDIRLKKDITPLQESLEKIIRLNGYHYHWIDDQSDNDLQTGLIAQEVQQLFPELVKQNKDGILSINYSGLIPVMIESIKQQQQQIATLTKLVQRLMGKKQGENVEMID